MMEVLFETVNLKKQFRSGQRTVYALNGVSLQIREGETLSLVGESGCGKTTLARTILGIYEPTEGAVYWKGKNVAELNRTEKIRFCHANQMIFQDPYTSLDPRMTAGMSITEGLRHVEKSPADQSSAGKMQGNMSRSDCTGRGKRLSRKKVDERVQELLETVGLNGEFAARFPHELSGGQRQRIGIARALAMNPDFLVLDEPIAALDVSIQAQIINLLMRLQKEKGLTYLMISHDLTMVRHISERVAVMYLGMVVEEGDTALIYDHPLHPYTRALMTAVPEADPDSSWLERDNFLKGEVPSPLKKPDGCPFAPRCPYVTEKCRAAAPSLCETEPGHRVACWKEF